MAKISWMTWAEIRRWALHEAMRPDLARATRAAVAFMGSFLATWHLGWPSVAMFAGMAAQNIAMIDVKGDYRARFCLLLAMQVVLAGSVGLGALAWSGELPMMLACTVLIAAGSGLWRHLSSDYGPTVAVVSALLFFVSLAGESHGGHVGPAVLATLAGGGMGMLLQVALWPWRAQHPLRRVVAESWLALARVFEVMGEENLDRNETTARNEKSNTQSVRRLSALRDPEGALRMAIDQADRMLVSAAPGSEAQKRVVAQLIELNLWAARLAMAAGAVYTLLEGEESEARVKGASTAEGGGGGDKRRSWRSQLSASAVPLFVGLANLGRSIAVTVVSRQPGHLAACEVRLRRLDGILRGLEARAQGLLATRATGLAKENGHSALKSGDIAHVAELLRELGQRLAGVETAVRPTIERADERAAFPLELLDLKTWQLRPLAATINLKPRLDRVLLRFTLRLTVLLMGGVTAFYLLDWPHGYWLPLTIMVVLQPDYGTTRARAAQRLAGTVAGSLLASGLLWLRLPAGVELGVIAVCVFLFCYLVRRNYAVAVFFVTVFVVLLMEASGAQTAGVALERTGATLAGGLVALGAAIVFWPVWERERLPPLMAGALRANRDYLAALVDRLAHGGVVDAPLVQAKRAAESANATVFSSLRRLYGDPRNRRDRVERAAVLANATQRLTRIATVLMLHVRRPAEAPHTVKEVQMEEEAARVISPAHEAVAQVIMNALDALASEAALGLDTPRTSGHRNAILAAHALALDTLELPPENPATDWATSGLGRAAAEVRALIEELGSA
ncbi:FUSC family protein [Geminisphaera colitermitum]|uniref:FUSC family protein n=1 Tax=Geminisphaera colitermitum TaxID=1148786 RepID=UPI0005B77736|nr:FUSC family protein [Geminisphaera colitermitum]